MATLQEMAANCRIRLVDPLPQSPSLRHMFQMVKDSTQTAFNRLANTGKAWATNEVQLNVSSGTEDYLIPVGVSFGKPLQVLTYYPQNPSTIERYVDFYDLTDLNFNWPFPQNLGSWIGNWDGSPNTAMRMAFFRVGGSDEVWVRVKPIPQLSATYTITYSIGNWVNDAALADSPLLSQFHQLFEVWACQSALPHSSWWADERENRERRKELAVSLKNDEMRFLPDWEMHIHSIHLDHMDTRVGAFDGDWP